MSKSKPAGHILSFQKSRPAIHVQDGAILMNELLRHDIPVASSCHGDGVCGKCRIQILSGASGLLPETEIEKEIRRKHNIPHGFRVSCQIRVTCDLKIDAPYW